MKQHQIIGINFWIFSHYSKVFIGLPWVQITHYMWIKLVKKLEIVALYIAKVIEEQKNTEVRYQGSFNLTVLEQDLLVW